MLEREMLEREMLERVETQELSPHAIRVLTEMRKLLQRGWIQRNWGSENGLCLIGALWVASRRLNNGASCQVRQAIREVLGRNTIVDWNDTPGRTQEEVLQLLDGILGRVRK